MSATLISDIAEAIKEALNAATFSQDFTAERIYVPEMDYTDVTDLQVKVFARSMSRQRESRASIRKEPEISITIAKRLTAIADPIASTGNDEIDAMLQLEDEIADAIALGGPYAGFPCLRVEAEPIFDFEVMRSHRIFVGLLSTFVYATN